MKTIRDVLILSGVHIEHVCWHKRMKQFPWDLGLLFLSLLILRWDRDGEGRQRQLERTSP